MLTCAVCGTAEDVHRCVQCRRVAYCGDKHAAVGWYTHGHYRFCDPVATVGSAVFMNAPAAFAGPLDSEEAPAPARKRSRSPPPRKRERSPSVPVDSDSSSDSDVKIISAGPRPALRRLRRRAAAPAVAGDVVDDGVITGPADRPAIAALMPGAPAHAALNAEEAKWVERVGASAARRWHDGQDVYIDNVVVPAGEQPITLAMIAQLYKNDWLSTDTISAYGELVARSRRGVAVARTYYGHALMDASRKLPATASADDRNFHTKRANDAAADGARLSAAYEKATGTLVSRAAGKVIVPVNIRDSHWVVLVADFAKHQLRCYDSLQWIDSATLERLYDTFCRTCPVVGNARPTPLARNPAAEDSMPQQAPGSGDCGVFVCAVVYAMATGQAPSDVIRAETARDFRRRLIWELLHQKLRPIK
jgi:hypothetical protein